MISESIGFDHDAASRTLRGLSGAELYGDDFSADEIAEWFEDEREGYFNLYHLDAPVDAQPSEPYTYEALAHRHGFRWLPRREYQHALGIGSANGAELTPVLERSARVTVLEPSDGFSVPEILGKPVNYIKPNASGLMPFASETFDLIICFSTLHHVPNVSTVIQEMFRVLKPGGHVLLREPTHSMGDWRQGRRGLTQRERGIPLTIFRSIVKDAGFQIVKETRCMFSIMSRLQRLLGRPVWTVNWVVRWDEWICKLPVWPQRYHATWAWQKIRPTGVAYVLKR